MPTTTNKPDATKATLSISLESVLENEIANKLEHSIKFNDGYSMEGVEYCDGVFIVRYTKDDDDDNVREIVCPIKGYDKDLDDVTVKIL